MYIEGRKLNQRDNVKHNYLIVWIIWITVVAIVASFIVVIPLIANGTEY